MPAEGRRCGRRGRHRAAMAAPACHSVFFLTKEPTDERAQHGVRLGFARRAAARRRLVHRPLPPSPETRATGRRAARGDGAEALRRQRQRFIRAHRLHRMRFARARLARASGRARVYSSAGASRAERHFAGATPYSVGIVALEEGVLLFTRLIRNPARSHRRAGGWISACSNSGSRCRFPGRGGMSGGPLAGVRVSNHAGDGRAARHHGVGDLGAEVIKVECGAATRRALGHALRRRCRADAVRLQPNKKSWRSTAHGGGRKAARPRPSCDVFAENSAGTVRRFGVDYERSAPCGRTSSIARSAALGRTGRWPRARCDLKVSGRRADGADRGSEGGR